MQSGYFQGAVMGMYMCHLLLLAMKIYIIYCEHDPSPIYVRLPHVCSFLTPSSFPFTTFRFIRCWNASLGHEIYRITAGLGGLGSGPELCVWSLLSLR